MATRPNGDVRVCCTANASGAGEEDVKDAGLVKHNGQVMNLQYSTVSEVWNSDYMKTIRLQMIDNNLDIHITIGYEEQNWVANVIHNTN